MGRLQPLVKWDSKRDGMSPTMRSVQTAYSITSSSLGFAFCIIARVWRWGCCYCPTRSTDTNLLNRVVIQTTHKSKTFLFRENPSASKDLTVAFSLCHVAASHVSHSSRHTHKTHQRTRFLLDACEVPILSTCSVLMSISGVANSF